LLTTHRAAWEAPLQGLGVKEVSWKWNRGFPEEACLSAATFLKEGDKLLQAAPVTSAVLTGALDVARLAACPHLGKLTDLALSFNGNNISDEGARALAQSNHLPRLTSLRLDNNNIGPEGARALADSPQLAGLTHLNLNGNHIGGEGARALAASPHLA